MPQSTGISLIPARRCVCSLQKPHMSVGGLSLIKGLALRHRVNVVLYLRPHGHQMSVENAAEGYLSCTRFLTKYTGTRLGMNYDSLR